MEAKHSMMQHSSQESMMICNIARKELDTVEELV